MSSRVALAMLCVATLLRSAAALPVDGRRLHVVDGRLLDHRDRELTLRGMNACVRGVFDVTFADGRLPLAQWITTSLDLQDRLRAHSTFWLWEEISEGRWGLFDGESSEAGGERVDRTAALSRTFARAVPGRVLEHAFDATANTLRLRFRARGSAPLEIVVPTRRYPGGVTLRCDGAPVDATPDAGVVTFRCGRGRGEHAVELAPVS